MNKITHILFDLGNTLVYFSGEWEQIFQKALEACGLALQRKGLQFNLHIFKGNLGSELLTYYERRKVDLVENTTLHLLRTTLARMGLAFYPDFVLQAGLDAFYKVTQRAWIPEEDALRTVRMLFNSGYRMGIVSNAAYDPDPIQQVEEAGLRPYMDFVLTSAAFGRRKPHPSIFSHAMGLWPALPEQVVMVGDRLDADILGAKNAGIKSIWLTRRATPAEMLQEQRPAEPDLTIPKLSDLEKIFNPAGA